MLTIDRVLRRTSGTGQLPLPLTGLARLGFGLGRGQLGMIGAAPGVGKSALAMHLALEMRVPTLYASPDTDAWTMAVRVLAHNSGHPQSYITTCLAGGHAADELDLAVHHAEHVAWTFDSYSTEEIHDDLLAYATVHGAWPELVVIDTLLNIARGADDDLSSQQKALDELHALAQTTSAHVLVLHHVTGRYDDGDQPVPLSGLTNKLSKLPAQVLTLHRRDGDLFACVVKNRQGRADPAGGLAARLRFDPERMTLRDAG